MDTHDVVENWRREAIQEGVKQGLQEGMKQGLQEVARNTLIDIYETRFGAIPDDVRAVIDQTCDERTLRTWGKLALTRGADEVAAEIRSARVS